MWHCVCAAATLCCSCRFQIECGWSLGLGSNQRPSGYEPDAPPAELPRDVAGSVRWYPAGIMCGRCEGRTRTSVTSICLPGSARRQLSGGPSKSVTSTWLDLNQQPLPYQGSALTVGATRRWSCAEHLNSHRKGRVVCSLSLAQLAVGGARTQSRTGTPFLAPAFEADASTCSAIRALVAGPALAAGDFQRMKLTRRSFSIPALTFCWRPRPGSNRRSPP